jgi:thiopeptide-type bacteriocin biosynthesis protein
MDALLSDLGLDLARKRALAGACRRSLGREHRADDDLWRRLGRKLRPERAALEALLDPSRDEASPLAPALAVLRERSARLAPVASSLLRLQSEGRLSVAIDRLGASFVQAHVNRLLRSAQRSHELVLWYFLDRIYEGREARARP